MMRRPNKSKFRLSPVVAKLRVESHSTRVQRRRRRSAFTARLTIDVTTDLRGRIKIAAFERGITVAYMLRNLLLKSFPRTKRGRR